MEKESYEWVMSVRVEEVLAAKTSLGASKVPLFTKCTEVASDC